MSNDLEVSKVAEHWGTTEGALWRTSKCLHWVEHPKVQERINFLVSRDRKRDRFQYFIDKYFGRRLRGGTRAKRILTLGCGHGEFERGLAKYHFAETHDAVDLSPGAIEDAKRLAESEGWRHIQYRVENLNSIQLPKCVYDVVFGISSIHHVAQLEHLFHQVVVSLKPGGYFLLDEFVGPNKFQWTDEQLAAANEQLCALPADFKRQILDGVLKGPMGRPAPEEVEAVDPSEAIRSGEILSTLRLYFDILEFRGYGGSLLHLLMGGIAGNFSEDDPRAVRCLEHLFQVEDDLIAAGKLQHDFAVIVARRKPTRVEKILGPKAAYVVSKTRAMWSRGL